MYMNFFDIIFCVENKKKAGYDNVEILQYFNRIFGNSLSNDIINAVA